MTISTTLKIKFEPHDAKLGAATAILAGADAQLATSGRSLDERAKGAITRAIKATSFQGRRKQSIEVLAPQGLEADRIVILGAGKDPSESDRVMLGGRLYAQLTARPATTASVVADLPGLAAASAGELAADIALGLVLRSYKFNKYKTKTQKADDNGDQNNKDADLQEISILTRNPREAEAAFVARSAIADGVLLARDLVNEPANALGPVEFADRIRALESSGLEVEIFDVPQLEKLGMKALLAVGQGSARPSRVAVMQWHGARSKRIKPLCFVGKGVVFDTGGLSMKPAAGMEDMKGDMAGAAGVTGLMLTLANRKAAVNAVGIVGLVENMPSGTAQRPGDIISSLSGQSIEVLNTDAEGRLVLADLLWYAEDRFKPRFMIDLATLTGAIMVALGKEFAGLFSNNDDLARNITAAGEVVGERSWRMPLDKAYDALIDTPNADMKNIGGRHGGAITAAQFLQRFVRECPWAHIDIAGTAMASNKTDTSQGWASGWGVRLLNQVVQDSHEK